MTNIIMIQEALTAQSHQMITTLLEQAGLSFEIRDGANAIIIYGTSDALRKAKDLLETHGIEVI